MLKDTILKESQSIFASLQAHRRWLHAHAETGFQLPQTLAYVRQQLESMGYDVQSCGRSGLVTTVGHGGKVILLRADMDALPIPEEAEVPYACPDGNMHACGHDFHTAMLLGAAKLLKNHEAELNGTVKLMFQSAEEILSGCKDMVAAGILEDPKVDAAMMIHLTVGQPIPAGMVIVSSPGITAPAADYFTIRVQGKGCHGSTPQQGIDALTAASHILLGLQEIHARELPAADESVLTIGTFQGGTASNVIADTAELGGTIRCYDEDSRTFLKERMTQIAQSIATAYRATAQVEFGSGCPTLYNDPALCTRMYDILSELLGPAVLDAGKLSQGKPARGGGSEDFAYITRQVPGLMLALAAGSPQDGHTYPLHHPKVTFDESILPVGAAVHAYAAISYLSD